METIRAKAAELKQAVGDDDTPEAGAARAIDVGVWVGLVTALIQALQDCRKKPAALPTTAKRPGVAGRVRARQVVRNTLAHADLGDETVGAVVRHVLAVGSKVTNAEAKSMFAEAASQESPDGN